MPRFAPAQLGEEILVLGGLSRCSEKRIVFEIGNRRHSGVRCLAQITNRAWRITSKTRDFREHERGMVIMADALVDGKCFTLQRGYIADSVSKTRQGQKGEGHCVVRGIGIRLPILLFDLFTYGMNFSTTKANGRENLPDRIIVSRCRSHFAESGERFLASIQVAKNVRVKPLDFEHRGIDRADRAKFRLLFVEPTKMTIEARKIDVSEIASRSLMNCGKHLVQRLIGPPSAAR